MKRALGLLAIVLVATLVSLGPASWLRAELRDGRAALLEIPTKQARPDLYYALDGHWTAAGHVYTAQRILEKLPELGI